MLRVGKSKSMVDDKKKPTSRSSRAGLQFPVGRIHRLLKVRAPQQQPAAFPRRAAASSSPGALLSADKAFKPCSSCPLQARVSANGRVGATAAVYTAAILGEQTRHSMGRLKTLVRVFDAARLLARRVPHC